MTVRFRLLLFAPICSCRAARRVRGNDEGPRGLDRMGRRMEGSGITRRGAGSEGEPCPQDSVSGDQKSPFASSGLAG